MMQSQQPHSTMTLTEKAEILASLSLFPALTMMVFLRRKVGYRFLSPLKLQAMALLLWALSGFSVFSGNTLSVVPLTLFALVMLITGMLKRRGMWWSLMRGESWHTYSRGISWFNSFLPLAEDEVKRFVDPAAVAGIGLLLSFLFPWLGYYILFSAVCLFIFEASDHERSINKMLDVLDGLVESEVVQGNVDYFSEGTKPAARAIEETAGIPTGVSPDLAAAIARRQARQAAPSVQQSYP